MSCEHCPMQKISERVSDAGMVKYGRIEPEDEAELEPTLTVPNELAIAKG